MGLASKMLEWLVVTLDRLGLSQWFRSRLDWRLWLMESMVGWDGASNCVYGPAFCTSMFEVDLLQHPWATRILSRARETVSCGNADIYARKDPYIATRYRRCQWIDERTQASHGGGVAACEVAVITLSNFSTVYTSQSKSKKEDEKMGKLT